VAQVSRLLWSGSVGATVAPANVKSSTEGGSAVGVAFPWKRAIRERLRR
jgi:hypothetical protein